MKYEIVFEDRYGDILSIQYKSLKEALHVFDMNFEDEFVLVKLYDVEKAKLLKTYYNRKLSLIHLSTKELLVVKVLKKGIKFKNEIRVSLNRALTEKELTETLSSLSSKKLIVFNPGNGWIWLGNKETPFSK